MKFCVFLDENSHFQLTNLAEKDLTIKTLIRLIQDDFNIKDYPPYKRMATQEWEKWLNQYQQRGLFEIIEL
jgi:hypothetical protein